MLLLVVVRWVFVCRIVCFLVGIYLMVCLVRILFNIRVFIQKPGTKLNENQQLFEYSLNFKVKWQRREFCSSKLAVIRGVTFEFCSIKCYSQTRCSMMRWWDCVFNRKLHARLTCMSINDIYFFDLVATIGVNHDIQWLNLVCRLHSYISMCTHPTTPAL